MSRRKFEREVFDAATLAPVPQAATTLAPHTPATPDPARRSAAPGSARAADPPVRAAASGSRAAVLRATPVRALRSTTR
jgi:hypothetical protein